MKAAIEVSNRALHAGYTYSWLCTMRARRPDPFEFSQSRAPSSGGSVRHAPVMLSEVLADLPLEPGCVAVDATLGLGGHALAMIEKIRPGGTLVGLDWDAAMLEAARERLGSPEGVRLVLRKEDFRNIGTVMKELGLHADAILFDLGLNTAQVLDPERGFSFLHPGPLDMRMDRSSGEPAAALLNRMSLGELERALREFGDERHAKAIARCILDRRKKAPLTTTQDLVECVLEAIPPRARERRIHPATRTFQAVRILVNRELQGLDRALFDAAGCLSPGGVLAVLTYHSGEDRIVKRAFRELADSGFEELRRKPLAPSLDEVRRNPRSRSAKLRSLRRSTSNDFQGRKLDPRMDPET